MKFFVTYCAMDGKLANPLWHACLILSYWPGPGEKIEVKNAVGFYGGPLSSPQSLFTKIKKLFGLNFDFHGNFGLLKTEEMRYLDLGYGLRGVTFDVSMEQFMQLKKRCKEQLFAQEQAIKEITRDLTIGGKVPNSAEIFAEENRRAIKEKRKPRLEPFDITLSLDFLDGLSLNKSRNCKTKSLALLQEIAIPQKYIDELTDYDFSRALPIIGGNLEHVFLHSAGPRNDFTSKRTGITTFFRKWDKPGTQLFWSLPPQNLVSTSKGAQAYFQISEDYLGTIRNLLKKLQEIERLVVNAKSSLEDNTYDRLIDHICHLYGAFATINSKMDESKIEERIAEANDFLNSLYYAINEAWTDEDEIESIANELPEHVQEKICKVLGYSLDKDSIEEFRSRANSRP